MLPVLSPVECPAVVYFAEPSQAFSSTIQSVVLSVVHPEINPEPSGCLSQQLSGLIQLDFSDLPSFTTVHDQYQTWGVTMDGAMAIRPSNPAFTDAKTSSGLMPATDGQPLSIQFQQLRQFASLSLVGAQQITLSAYDANNQLVAAQQVGRSDYRQSRQTASTCARYQVQLAAKAIARIEVYSDAPFLLLGLLCG
jgi:hypothetical protein